jgi:arsenite-transporting ATPase
MEDKTIGGADMAEKEKESRIRQILLRRRHKFSHLRDTLADAELTSFIIVLAAERLPVLESIELYQQLGKSGVSIGGLVVNKRSPQGQGEFLEARRSQEDKHLATLDAELADVPRQELVLAGQDVVGLAALEQFAGSLAGA